MKYLQYGLAIMAAVLYALSLQMTFLVGSGGSGLSVPGYILVGVGWLDTSQGIFAWWANILAIAAFIYVLSGRGRRSLILSSIAFALGLQYLYFQGKTVSYFDSNGPFGILSTGYYLWEFSFILLMIASFVSYRQSRNLITIGNFGSNNTH